MRKYMASAVLFLGSAINAQNIFTVAGIPYTHRNSVDSQAALGAPLGSVYALLNDKSTGRLIFNDEFLVLRVEPDGTLLALAGAGPILTPEPQTFRSGPTGSGPTGSTWASVLNVVVLRGMAQDAAGALYLSDAGAGRVYRVAPDGTVTTFAGGGTQPPGIPSDGGLATAARLDSPRGLVFDSKGNLDIAEVFCNCIRQVTPGGIISTLYSIPPSGTPARLPNIEGLAIDAKDNLYFTEWLGNQVVKVAADGSAATTVAGTGGTGFSGDGAAATAAQLNGPSGVAMDRNGTLYIADTENHRIRAVGANGTITTIAGTGTCGSAGDGGPATTAQLCKPAGMIFDSSGSLLIADYGNRRVRKMTAHGTIATIAGSGTKDTSLSPAGSSGNGGPQIHATFDLVGGIAFDSAGNLYVSETRGNIIRKISPNGTVSTFAGTGRQNNAGDGGPATQADIAAPGPLSVGPDGALYLITGDGRIRKITPDGTIAPVAGTGTGTGLNRSQGDGGPAVNATLNEPGGVAFNQQGDIYIADTSNARVRKIDRNGIITTVAGPGQQGVDYYNAVAVDPQGNLYVAWTHATPPSIYATVNRVNPDGSLTRVAGSGQPCTGGPGQFGSEGTPATQARLCAVTGLAMDHSGLLYMSEGGYAQVLLLTAGGTIHRIAGATSPSDFGDGGPALEANLVGGQGWSPETVAFDPAGNLFMAEPGLNFIRKVIQAQYKVEVSPNRIDAAGTTAQSQTLTMSANFVEPFPYAVRVSTADGAPWLQVNRVTGITGESISVMMSPAGLGRGTYHGTVSVVISVPVGVASQVVDVPVVLTVP